MEDNLKICEHIPDSIHLFCQKKLIDHHYDWLDCKIKNDLGMFCTGTLRPSSLCDEYKIEIYYQTGTPPKVYIISPKIEYNDEIHLYYDRSLCLYYPKDMPWGKHIMLADTIIPWISEWIIFYELWKESGKWEAPEVKHRRILNNAA